MWVLSQVVLPGKLGSWLAQAAQELTNAQVWITAPLPCVFSLRGKRLKIRTDTTLDLCDMVMKNRASYTLEIVKIFFFIFLSFGYHFIYHFFFIYVFIHFFLIILFFICLSFYFSFFLFFSFFSFFFIFIFLSFFIIFASSGAKIFRKIKNCNFPRVFFNFLSFFLSFFYHFCFQWWN